MIIDVDSNGKGFVKINRHYNVDQKRPCSRSAYYDMGILHEIIEEESMNVSVLDMLDFWKHHYERERKKIDSMLWAINKEMKTRIG